MSINTTPRTRLSAAYRGASRLFKGYILGDRMEREAARWFRDRGDETLRLDYPLDSNSIVFDCGGFEGDWAAAIHGKYACRVFVFEPVASFLADINHRFSSNPKIQAFEFGLHSSNERTTIHLDGNASSVFGKVTASESIELRDVAGVLPELNVDYIDLIKINIEGGEFELLERLLNTGLINHVGNIQVQFHRFVPDAAMRRGRIRQRLAETHMLSYDYEFIWESWTRRLPKQR